LKIARDELKKAKQRLKENNSELLEAEQELKDGIVADSSRNKNRFFVNLFLVKMLFSVESQKDDIKKYETKINSYYDNIIAIGGSLRFIQIEIDHLKFLIEMLPDRKKPCQESLNNILDKLTKLNDKANKKD